MNEAEKRILMISNSGASFKVEHLGKGKHFLLKTVFSDIPRSQKNIDKQKLQEKIHFENYRIQAVPILVDSYSSDTHLVKMLYIDGISAEKFLVRGSRTVSKQLKGSIGLFLEKTLDKSCNKEICSSVFVQKAEAVLEATECPYLKNEVKACSDVLQKYCLKDYDFPVGECHGDLTLSNMIISSDGTLHLIDYLDTFLESPLQDVVKIMQDFDHGWSFRYEKPAAKLSARIFCMHSTPLVLNELKREYCVQIKILSILNLMRIAPYVNDELTRDWLIGVLRKEAAK